MTASIDVAWGEINARLHEEWTGDVLSATIPLLWDNVLGEPPQTRDANGNALPWARFVVRHAQGGNAAIGPRLFDRVGVGILSVFTPVGQPLLLYQLMAIGMRAFDGQSTPSGVWFRDVSPREVGPDGDWFQGNVVVSFTYDELR